MQLPDIVYKLKGKEVYFVRVEGSDSVLSYAPNRNEYGDPPIHNQREFEQWTKNLLKSDYAEFSKRESMNPMPLEYFLRTYKTDLVSED